MLKQCFYSPFLVQLVVTRKCNLSCSYCNEFDKTSEPVSTETLKIWLDKIKALGTLAIEFTGGEPLLHPDICDLVRYARDIGFFRVMMLSNAYLFTEEKIHQLNEAGLQHLQISIDGLKPNDMTVKVLDPLREKLLLLEKHAKFKLCLSAVLGCASANEVSEVVQFAKQHNYRPRVLILHDENGQINLKQEELAVFLKTRQEIGQRFREAHDYRTRLIKKGRAPFKCRAGSRYIYIDEFGLAHWCSQTRDKFGLPISDYTFAHLKEQFREKKTCDERCTIGCARSCSSYESWRAQTDSRK